MSRENYAVLIPTKGRPRSLGKLFAACPSLNSSSTYLGVEPEELELYQPVLSTLNDVVVVPVYNADGITSVARQTLKRAAQGRGYRQYVLTDDNCRFSNQSLRSLLRAHRRGGRHCVMAGSHPTAKFFHQSQIQRTGRVDRVSKLTIYEQVGMIYWCVPAELYDRFDYPPDCYYDDVYFILWCLTQGVTNFKACLEATFEKHRHEAGGTGNAADRVAKMGRGLTRLALDFPQWMTPQHVQTRVPYTRMIKAVRNGQSGIEV